MQSEKMSEKSEKERQIVVEALRAASEHKVDLTEAFLAIIIAHLVFIEDRLGISFEAKHDK